MKKSILILSSILFSLSISAGHVIYVHQGGEIVEDEKCSDLDSVRFVGEQALFIMEDGEQFSYDYNSVDSVTFEEIKSAEDTVFVTYRQGLAPEVVNPFPTEIEVVIDGGGVFVNCHTQLENVVYSLSGATNDGVFQIDSERKFILQLNNLSMSSAGVLSPIRSFAGSSMQVELVGENSLSDTPADTCNAVLRSKGQIVFGGTGSLTVVANSKRGIQSGDYIQINSGVIGVVAPYGDALKVNDYFLMNDGLLSVLGNGIEVEKGYMEINGGTINYKNVDVATETYIDDAKGLKCDRDSLLPLSPTNGTITINGGSLSFDVGGVVSRFIRCGGDVVVNGGSISGTLNAVPYYDDSLEDYSHQCVIKADGVIKMLGGSHDILVAESSVGGRGLVSDSSIVFDGGVYLNLVMACEPYVSEKNSKLKSGFGLKCDGGSVIMQNCNVNILGTSSNKSPIAIAADTFIVNAGTTAQLVSYTNEYCDIMYLMKLNGGEVVTIGSSSSTGVTTVTNGGVMVSLGLSEYGYHFISPASTAASIKHTSTIGSAIRVESQAGQEMLTYKIPSPINTTSSGSVYVYVYGPYQKGTAYTLYSGGTISGGTAVNGIYKGASYSGGTTYSFTTSSSVTEVK